MTQQLKYNLYTHTPKCNKNLKINKYHYLQNGSFYSLCHGVIVLFNVLFNTQALLQSRGPSHGLQGSSVATHSSASGKSDPSTGTSFARLHIISHRRRGISSEELEDGHTDGNPEVSQPQSRTTPSHGQEA